MFRAFFVTTSPSQFQSPKPARSRSRFIRTCKRLLLIVQLAITVLLVSEPPTAQRKGQQGQLTDCEGAWSLGTTPIRRGALPTYWSQLATPGAVTKRLVTVQHKNIGSVTATIAGGTLTVSYAIDADQPWELTKTDLYVGDVPPLRAAPLQFPHHSGPITATSHQFSIPVDRPITLYLAAYAEVCPRERDPNDLGTGTLDETGGTLTFPGLTIDVNPGELLDPVTFDVTLVPPPAALPAGATANGTSFDISLLTGLHALDAPLSLRFTGLSDDGDPDTILTVLHFNEVLGEYEPLTLWETADTYAVVESRAFSTFTPIWLSLQQAPPIHFLPGFSSDRKGWLIDNFSSFLTEGGNCGGMAAYAAWMYKAHPEENLYSMYPGDSAEIVALRAQMTQAGFRRRMAHPPFLGLTEVQIGLYARAALAMFDDPLYVSLSNSRGGARHAVTIFGYDDLGFRFYDPNAPGGDPVPPAVEGERNLRWNSNTGFSRYRYDGLEYNVFQIFSGPSTGAYADFQALHDEAERGYDDTRITITEPLGGGDLDQCETLVTGTLKDPDWSRVALYADRMEKGQALEQGDQDFDFAAVPLRSGENLLIVVAGEDLDDPLSFGSNAARAIRVTNGETSGFPVVDSVTPSGLDIAAGEVGDFVVFSAVIHGQQPTSYLWDFGDGVTDPEASRDPEPIVQLLTPGPYVGRLFVENACGFYDVNNDGIEDFFEFYYQIDECPTLSINNVTPRSGSPGQAVTFEAEATGSPRTFEWNFGGGATPNAPFEQEPTVTLGGNGTYPSFVKMTDACGNTDQLNFSLVVGVPPYYTRTYQGTVTDRLVTECGENYVCSRETTGSFQGNVFRTEETPDDEFLCYNVAFRANPATFLPTGWSDPFSTPCAETTSVGVVNGDQIEITMTTTYLGVGVVGCVQCNAFKSATFTGTAIQ